MNEYYSFIQSIFLFVFLPIYIASKWYSYYLEKEREKTLRQAMKTGEGLE
jgi:cbb3-type cytochrome oxidase subunit 3